MRQMGVLAGTSTTLSQNRPVVPPHKMPKMTSKTKEKQKENKKKKLKGGWAEKRRRSRTRAAADASSAVAYRGTAPKARA